MDFAEFLKKELKTNQLGITNAELCRRLGKTHNYINSIIEKNNPTLKVVEAIIKEFGYKITLEKIDRESSIEITEITENIEDKKL